MSESSDKRKRASVAAVFWIVLALILLIFFLINQNTIVRILKETNFFVHVFGEQPEFIENYNLPNDDSFPEEVIVLGEENFLPDTLDAETAQEIREAQSLLSLEQEADPLDEEVTTQEIDNYVEESTIREQSPARETEQVLEPVQNVMSQQTLFFVFVNGDGTVERKESIRSVPKTTTPLTASIKALIDGPNAEEKNKGYMSFIPTGTKLLSASIQDGTALINMSEEFSFNQYGVEGYIAQLMQVVYTATSFSTIKNVRFFIEGEQSSYLGNDGVWIGAPLARTDFK